jgi:hypothetical protein
MSACPHCGSDNDPGNEHCQNCSRPLETSASARPATARSHTLFGVAAPPERAEAAVGTLPGRPGQADKLGDERADAPGGPARRDEGDKRAATIPGGPARADEDERPVDTSAGGTQAPEASRRGVTFGGIGPGSGRSAERTLLGVAPGQPVSARSSPPGGPVVTIAGGINRTLGGVARDAPLDQTIMGSFAPVPASARGATSPGVGSSGKARTLPGPGEGPFAAVPAARVPLGMTHGPWLAGAAAADGEAVPAEPKPTAPPDVDSALNEAPAPAAAAVEAPVALSSFGKTHLGVATPGIAPIRMTSASAAPVAGGPTPAATALQHTAPLQPRSAGPATTTGL